MPKGRLALAASSGAALFGLAGDEAVTSLGVVVDAPLAHQRSHDGADGAVAGGGAFADPALREGRIGFGERLEDSPLGGIGPRRGPVR